MPEGNAPAGPSQPKKIFVNDFSSPAPAAPAAAPVATQPEVSAPPVAQEPVPVAPPPQATVEPSPPPAGPYQPAQPAQSNVPKFGELQPKVDAHPLFSGAKEPKPKAPRRWLKRTIAPVIALFIAVILLYLAVDAGIIKGYSHLPFHFFKSPVATVAPTITPAKNTTQAPVTTQNPSQVTADKFIGAMQQKNKPLADSLQSAAFGAQLIKTVGTSSFYDYCQKSGVLCTAAFENSYLSSATKTTAVYKSTSGVAGTEILYSKTVPNGGGTTESHLAIDVVPNGSTYQIDKVDIGSSNTNVNLTPTH